MKNLLLAAALAASSVACGCASTDTDSSNAPVAEREYQTGSNIPRRSANSAVTTVDREAAERARDMQLPSTGQPFKP